eukprot:jgi/Botrbrau1/19317/Bobra.0073s0050.4
MKTLGLSWDRTNIANQTSHKVQILHNTCYPGEADDCEGWLECCTRITFLHDAAECQWILLWIQQFERRQLAGMATVVAYHTSLYGFNFAVHPQFRRLGFGRRIMHEAQLYALTLGLHQVSATVDASEPRLLKYYVNLGARVVSSGIMSQESAPGPTVKIVRDFTREDVLACICEVDEVITSNFLKPPSRCWVAQTLGLPSGLLSGRLAACAAVMVIVLLSPFIVVERRLRTIRTQEHSLGGTQ